jgi:hypothetical protein
MRSNRNHLAIIQKSSRALLTLGCGSLLTVASLDRAIAQDPGTTGTTPANSPTTDTSANVAGSTDANAPAAGPVEPLPPDANPADQSRGVVPGVNQNPANPTPTTIPLFPAQLGNPISPYTSSSSNPQAPQLIQPNLYVTGTNDVSRIGTNNALTQAFSQQNSGLSSEEAGMNYEHPPIERLKLGPFDLKAAVVGSVVGDDNVRNGGNNGTGTGSKKGDVEFGITPAILLAYGLHDGQKGSATLVYSPTINQYYHESNQNGVDQNVAFNAFYPLQRLTFNFTQTFTESTGTNQDSNERTTQDASLTGFGLNYEVDEKISLASQVQYLNTSFSAPGNNDQNGTANSGTGGQGDQTLTVNNTANYRLSDKLTFGPSINVGWDRPQDSQKSTYEQGLIGLNYAPTQKIGAYAQGGVELRQYDSGGDKANPIFAVGLGYTPFDSTAINVNATQASHTSTAQLNQPTGGQTILNTSVGASITQRIVQRVYVGFNFNYSHEDDQGQAGGGVGGGSGNNNGSEDTFAYRPTVTYAPTAWSNIAVYYQYLSNESNIQGESYNDNQIGLTLSAQF